MKNEIRFRPIGIIHTPFKKVKGVPIQPRAGKGIKGKIEVYPEYVDGLKDLDGFSHIILLYHLHLARHYKLQVVPFMDNKIRGLFATRAPARPNPIGISVVRLINVVDNIIYIKDLDIIDKTPLLDIKPYVREFDNPEVIKIGWLQSRIKRLNKTRDNGRFIRQGQ